MCNASMDKGAHHEKKFQGLKTVLTEDSAESDTESLAQEKAYRQQQKTFKETDPTLSGMEKKDSSQCGYSKDNSEREDESEALQVYDSLEEVTHPHVRRTPTPLQTHAKLDESEATHHRLSDNACNDSYICSDADRRTKKGAFDCFNNPHISLHQYDHKEKCNQTCGNMVVKKGEYSYIVDTRTPAVVTETESEQPYYLHPENSQVSSVMSTESQPGVRQTDLSTPSRVFSENHCNNTPQKSFRKNCEQELGHTHGGCTQTQPKNTSAKNKKLEQVKEDIVERNKMTLGRNTSRYGSYLQMHTRKHGVNLNGSEAVVPESDTRSRSNTANDIVTQNSEEKTAQRNQSTNLSALITPQMRTEIEDSLSSPLAREDAPQMTTPLQPLPPTYNLNISPLLLPIPQQKALDTFDSITFQHSLFGGGNLGPASEDKHTANSGCHQGNVGKAFQEGRTAGDNSRKTVIPGSYKVLPPIEKPLSREEFQQNPNQSAETVSDGYLVRMEKQRQMKTKVTYKAEKMTQQKLYANVILEQKKINRIPFIPTTDPKDNEKKILRMKALEYAKTIVKPPVRSKPKKKQREQFKGFIEGLNTSQLATVEVLRQRHEEEKKAMALLRKAFIIRGNVQVT